ncbi:hypothetical protein BKA62DRAFT_611033 [Auriculariales sp. MPI-PUGE-AT-0066]|nr:hypothetical protein BKA62DRAFT_611033 [Auriculariales sp. MPI-PUGE-AT-0066]
MFSSLLRLAVVAASLNSAGAVNILFVGNSFTYAKFEPALSYNKDSITDVNNMGFGGVPGIFKKLADTAGLDYNVTIEAVGGQTLEYHYETHASIIAQPQWEIVVLQEYSTLPCPTSRTGNPTLFAQGVSNVIGLVRANSNATIYLYETWVRPDLVYPADTPYEGTDIHEMQTDLHDGYTLEAGKNSVAGTAWVGDAFVRAVDVGLSDGNPYDNITATLDVWGSDHYHPSVYGSYLSAVTIFSTITGVDATAIPNGDDTAASGLGISSDLATQLQAVSAA